MEAMINKRANRRSKLFKSTKEFKLNEYFLQRKNYLYQKRFNKQDLLSLRQKLPDVLQKTLPEHVIQFVTQKKIDQRYNQFIKKARVDRLVREQD